MIERKLNGLSSLFLLGAPLALAPLGGACGGSAASDHAGTSGASATAIGGASGSGVGSGSTAGTIGAATSGGTSGSGASAGMMVPYELCSLSATCNNGVIRGVLGNYCTPFGATCEFGCRDTTFTHAYLGIEHDFDVALAGQLAADALCNDGEGGSGGDNAAGASGSAAQAGAGGD